MSCAGMTAANTDKDAQEKREPRQVPFLHAVLDTQRYFDYIRLRSGKNSFHPMTLTFSLNR
jgi:hypothetical protein